VSEAEEASAVAVEAAAWDAVPTTVAPQRISLMQTLRRELRARFTIFSHFFEYRQVGAAELQRDG
jgi:hypothetical protein